ncbi:MAG TPA: TlpA disulfide reductase family protein [Solirubrobacteraceae bacterium]|nr:TlpA disulfide reductase family protein [Solirubrobacteraceae bacterium]
MRRFVLPGLIAAAAVALLALLTFGVSNNADSSSIDSQVARGQFPAAPNAHQALPVLGSSNKGNLAEFHGKVVVLNVFASWCPPCRAEAPLLAKEQQMLARHDATLVGVTYKDLSSATEQFAHQYHITYPVLRDVTGSFAQSFGVDGVPETFVINRKGQIQALNRSQLTAQWLDKTVPPILAEKS